MRTIALALAAFFVAFTGTAIAASSTVAVASAAEVVAPDASWLDLAQPVIKALTSGNPALACACALVLAVFLARTYGSKRFPILATDAGGTALTFLASFGAACAAAFSAGALPTTALLWTSLTIAAGASGGYTAVKRLIVPALRWAEGKLPASLRKFVSPLFNLALFFFENRKGGQVAIAKAEAAGTAAVEAAPSKGAEGVVKVGKSFP